MSYKITDAIRLLHRIPGDGNLANRLLSFILSFILCSVLCMSICNRTELLNIIDLASNQPESSERSSGDTSEEPVDNYELEEEVEEGVKKVKSQIFGSVDFSKSMISSKELLVHITSIKHAFFCLTFSKYLRFSCLKLPL